MSNPIHIHLEHNELRICVLDQQIEWHLSIDRWKLIVVIVKSKLKSRLLCLFARLVEQISNFLVTVDRSVLLIDPRTDDILLSDCMGVFEDLVPAGAKLREA